MFFKINNPDEDKYTEMGMVQLSASFYLENDDDGYDKYMAEHYVTLPIIPEGGYQGKTDKNGSPADVDDYNAWIKSLPTETKLNPFCNHSIQFEANVTEEEILWCFEFALAQTHRNYLLDDLKCESSGRTVNIPINYLSRKAFYEGIKQIPDGQRTLYMKKEMGKCDSAKVKIKALKEKDFTKVDTIEKYRVK